MDFQKLWNDLEKVAQKYDYEMGVLTNSEDTIDIMLVKKGDANNEKTDK